MSIQLSVDGPIATVTITRPEAMNAIDMKTRAALADAWDGLARDDAIRAIVLTGAGERAFSAGVDLKEAQPGAGPARDAFGPGGPRPITAGMDIDKPIIAAVNGVALGGGFELALASDIRIASETARFGLTEVKVGSLPGAGGTQRLTRTIGRSDAMVMLLTGRVVDAAEALRTGIVSALHAPGALLDAARALAEEIAACAPLSVAATKRVVRAGDGLPLDAALQLERLAFGLIRTSEDRREGREAFKARRKPAFRGA
jgi:E-phenylitaconyl-CoA hydratase